MYNKPYLNRGKPTCPVTTPRWIGIVRVNDGFIFYKTGATHRYCENAICFCNKVTTQVSIHWDILTGVRTEPSSCKHIHAFHFISHLYLVLIVLHDNSFCSKTKIVGTAFCWRGGSNVYSKIINFFFFKFSFTSLSRLFQLI